MKPSMARARSPISSVRSIFSRVLRCPLAISFIMSTPCVSGFVMDWVRTQPTTMEKSTAMPMKMYMRRLAPSAMTVLSSEVFLARVIFWL